jgi:hypothetical protein
MMPLTLQIRIACGNSMAADAETYDSTLSSFLKRFLERDDAANTIIVVRADHGLQGGPSSPDYSLQIEALRPWTEIIVPKALPGLSLDNLFINRQRLVTGFDFYNTITTSIMGKNKELMKELPVYSMHLWNGVIPATRSCLDTGVRPAYCIYESQRSFSAPNLRSCKFV